ncbi:hypothetical protein V1525DRAFT_391469 [Lipomyces kononenkoae]|uniref:Uncharacterized protein n=1 Tax=Lipomyces kononenkoae TaxID=34357 RepID=A0ACC3SS13_LIPKO
MGSGKTHCVKPYLQVNPWLSVLSVTSRQPLARYLSSGLGLEGYLESNFWALNARDRRRRCVVCLDSVSKLLSDEEPYDMTAIDECVCVQYHFSAGTITGGLGRRHADLRETAAGIRAIPETTAAFYMRALDLNSDSPGVVRRKVMAAVTFHPMEVGVEAEVVTLYD